MFKLYFATVVLVSAVTTIPVRKNYEEAGFVEGDMRFSGERNVVTNTALRWTSKTVYYDISTDFPSSERNIILGAINAIQSVTCIKFVQRTTQTNYVYVTREESGCWSYVGMIKGRQQLNLKGPNCVTHGITIHEFLHALGFYHQHSATDRDQYVKIQLENVQSGQENAFNKYSSSFITDYGYGYDYSSVMHYGPYAFSKNGQKTIITTDPNAEIGQRAGLSLKDIQKIKAAYSC